MFKTSTKRTLAAVLFTTFFISSSTWNQNKAIAQGVSQAPPALDCRFVYPIQMLYLSQHIKTNQFDAELEKRVIDQYIKHLDPTKIYLLQSDVATIETKLKNHFEKIKNRDCGFLDEIQKMFVDRVKSRAEFAKTFLGKKYKFDKKVEFVFDPQKKLFPKTDTEADAFLANYIHFQISNYLATDIKIPEAKTNVIKTWDRAIKRSTEVKKDEVISNYLDAFGGALDPHSSFFSRDGNEDFRIQMGLSLEGIGATLSSQDGFTVVEALVPGGAAAKSGLIQPKDKILAVGQGPAGSKGPMENVIEMDLRDVVKKIRGKKGTPVRLLILRQKSEGKSRLEVSLIREKINLKDEAAQIHYIDREADGVKRKIAVLNLPAFYADARRGGRSSAADMKKLLAEAKTKKAEGLVLDFSTNGGGSLDDAVKIAGLFFKTGNVVKQSSREEGKNEIVLKDVDAQVDWSGPLVILTSRISASASEIVAGTLKDYKRALIVGGDHTFGKGSVQSVLDIPPQSGEMGAVKITIGMFFIAGGNSTQHRGVEGDVILPSPYNIDEIGEKSLDYSLPPKQIPAFLSADAYVREGADAWKEIKPEWIKVLAQKSKERVDKNEEFKKIITDLEKTKTKGKLIRVGDADKEKEKKEKIKASKMADETEREKEYLKRPEIVEASNILMDLIKIEN